MCFFIHRTKNVDISTEHKVELITKQNNNNNVGMFNKSVGFTESKSKNNLDKTIIFQQFFAIPYYFEKQQLLEFKIFFNNNEFELIQTSLGTIMGSRGQTLKKMLKNGEEIYIKGKELKKSSKEVVFDATLEGNNLIGMKFRYAIFDLGTENKPTNMKLYDSEVKSVNKNTFEKKKLFF